MSKTKETNGTKTLKHILNIELIKSFLHSSGSIKSAIVLGNTVKQQKKLSTIIKRARFLGLIKTSYI